MAGAITEVSEPQLLFADSPSSSFMEEKKVVAVVEVGVEEEEEKKEIVGRTRVTAL